MSYVESLDEISFDAEHDGDLVRRTIARRSWTDRGWATVMILFEERARDRETWRPPKLVLLRMRRSGDGWKKQASVTLPAGHVTGLLTELEPHAATLAAPGRDPDDA